MPRPVQKVYVAAGWAAMVTMILLGVAPAATLQPAFSSTNFGPNDDGSYPCTGSAAGTPGGCTPAPVALGFNVNFYGHNFNSVFVNNNGNITFNSALPTFTPFGLTSDIGTPIVAPYFADVDTRAGNSVTFGNGNFQGHAAFGVTWNNVGYYSQHTDKTNSFQALLVNRSDTGVGNFDIVFNYNKVQWETGDASGGVGGLGGTSAVAGYSNGTGSPGTSLELPGSGINGALLDANSVTGLINHSQGSDMPGQYVFSIRNGTLGPTLPTSGSSAPVNFDFPLQATADVPAGMPAYQLITQAGGLSSDGTTDPFHTGGGYFSLDFRANENANVIAGGAGLVVRVCATYDCPGTNPMTDPGPVIDVYNGNGYFTEYREFTAFPMNSLVQVGDYVSGQQVLGNFIPGDTNNIINQNGETALHFQVKYTPNFTAPCLVALTCKTLLRSALSAFGSGTGLSAQTVPQLQIVTLDGKGLASPTYQFQRDSNGHLILPAAVGPAVTNGFVRSASTPSLSTFETIDTTVVGSTAMLVEHSPAYLWREVTIPADVKYLSFDYFWPSPGDGDFLTVYLGNQLLFSSLGSNFSGSNYKSSGLIDIGNFEGQTDQLLFWLNSVGSSNAEVDVRNLAFYSTAAAQAPIPNSAVLLVSGVLVLASFVRLRTSRPGK